MKTFEYWVEKLDLLPHPEGGYYKETYRSEETIKKEHLPERFTGDRNFKTSIFYLIKAGTVSRLHRISSDELWHFYYGNSLTVIVIDKQGNRNDILLGSDPGKGESFQGIVRAGDWFGAKVTEGEYSLVGCTVSPGFDFDDFEMGEKEKLLELFPQYKSIIEELT